jgi:hypothetical protein
MEDFDLRGTMATEQKWAEDIAKGCASFGKELGLSKEDIKRFIDWQAKSMDVIANHMSPLAQMRVAEELKKVPEAIWGE